MKIGKQCKIYGFTYVTKIPASKTDHLFNIRMKTDVGSTGRTVLKR